MQALTEFVRELGIDCESLENRFEIKRVLEAIRNRPEERAVHYAVLRSFQKAVYSPKDEGHYALASDCYCHFTSPIRRYPDLTVHRLLDALARHQTPVQDMDRLLVLGEHCSQREQRAAAAERELIKVKLLEHLEQQIGLEMDAVVTGVEQYGLFAQGLVLPADGLIPIHSLQDDQYVFDRASHSLTGRKHDNSYRLGDLVHVQVAHVDIDKRELDFRLLGRLPRAPRLARATQKEPHEKPAGTKQKATVSGRGKPKSERVAGKTRSPKSGQKNAGQKNTGQKKAGQKKAGQQKIGQQKTSQQKPAAQGPVKSRRQRRRKSSGPS